MRRSSSACVQIASVLLLGLVAGRSSADAIDDYVRTAMENQRLPGLALAVVRDGQEPILRSYGVANVDERTPVSSDTVFRIGAMSKQFIAAGIMLLEADGKISLQDPVTRFLADAPPSWKAITIEHLLTHTSGLAREAPGFDPNGHQKVVDVIRSSYDALLASAPNGQFLYGNLDYFILAEIITRASGKPWTAYLRERIFTPLQMSATSDAGALEPAPNRANGYVFRDNELRLAPASLASRPSGALASSLADLVKWDEALRSQRLLPQKALGRMWTPATLPSGNSTGYGFGWWTDVYSRHRRVRHGGESSGYRTEYVRFPDDGVSVIVLANGESARPDAIAIEVASQFIEGLSLGRKTISLDRTTLRTFAGRYQLAPDNILTIGVDGEGLSVQSSAGGAQYHLAAESPTTFFISPEETYQFTIFRDVAVRLSIRAGVQLLEARRVD
jgi:CubicO group peptidase (beta-lactamase class C family)